MKSFWKWLAIFAYRRWASAEGKKPVGVPGNRDPEHICTSFAPRAPKLGDWRDCNTDGHWLCAECCHRNPEGPAQGRDWIQVTTHKSGGRE